MNETSANLFNGFCENLFSGREDVAQKILSSQLRQDRVNIRLCYHMEAKIQIASGDYRQAIKVIEEALSTCGPHIGLLCDLITSYYFLEQRAELIHHLEKAIAELKSCETKLDIQTHVKTKIFLSKIFEETGDVYQARQLYHSLLKIKGLSVSQMITINTQLLRFKCFFGTTNDIHTSYNYLFEAVKSNYSTHFKIEVEHSLLVAEVILLGLKNAKPRLERLLSHTETLDEDKKFLLFDMLELTMRENKTEETNSILKLISSYDFDLCDSEKTLLDIAADKEYDLIAISQKVPMGQFLRIATCSKNIDKKWLNFLLSGLSEGSKKTWVNLFDLSDVTDSNELSIINSGIKLIGPLLEINLGRKKSLKTIIKTFSETRSISDEELMQILWPDAIIDFSLEERLRTTIRRANTDFNKVCGQSALTLNSGRIELASNIKIQQNK